MRLRGGDRRLARVHAVRPVWGYQQARRGLFRRFGGFHRAIDQTRGWFYTLLSINTCCLVRKGRGARARDEGSRRRMAMALSPGITTRS